TDGLDELYGLKAPYVEPYNDPVYHQYTIKVENGRDELISNLSDNGVGSKVFYPTTIPSSPAMTKFNDGPYQKAESAAREVLSLPVHPGLTEEEVNTVVKMIKKARGV
ncbi:MAG: DegT/DnrJ/EryC1/StrS family aminotransferase, partial [Candidatus Thermoplasmatota archaeon]|nr:DegT/DnrJ/EryC1/StrS family aminotransferase [Candidatus Thermoplasmatota archaeon]